ncbi:MAG: hypothetical protein A3A28_05670 [Candidatus Sungbacteria bacterium RIFCSPLOWO2_01_FULL_47_32]|uniref:DUF3105 domain-containing protein n=1 Tax=Candidatus Sungbacteria bacterium RIFCSPHIGHO2_01_FULL_47_32 TaxID=1802264 RepID=A0A1G2K7A1_9BACT|nr:MAG: hypothetical protein UX72_C0001G0135 [Parcubacteria group bacterium GW2011_GWA2_47_10]OGZ94451.1 MAG: hypothetical protein A2633_04205 [Candidatus Sungbacteria bacterium RIFCSPHIGHO2_01_FULL_47_32]OGZ98043.1 MAG: hypothetical protein A3D57_02910 [Candidatus Sungbacteria bacterium RIFCSPHIGHO2_02_FULL_46_12]OHA05793.1 MAG: hypothetical protein A3A28_05670 [Candidatus Sungbacteria bacterium RIFCSPLOWO2_01_FULL_47_32]
MNQEKQERIRQAKRKQALKTFIIWAGIAVLLVGFVWGIIAVLKYKNTNLPGTFYQEVGREHVGLNDPLPVAYNSNPPSSGAHFSQQANWGIYDYEVNDRIFMHNLEHGGIWIAYRPGIPQNAVDDLKAIVNEYSRAKLVMGPRSANDADIALVSWSRVSKFSLAGGSLTYEQKNEIRSFYRSLRDHGPELVPDNTPGIDPKSVQ